MKLINLTQTIVLLYDQDVMHGQINPGCVSNDLDPATVQKSIAIQKYLSQGIVKIFDEKKDKLSGTAPRISSESVTAAQKTLDSDITTFPPPIVDRFKEVKAQNIPAPVIQGISKDSIDYIEGMSDEAELISKNKKDPIGGTSEKMSEIVKKNTTKASKKLKEVVDLNEAEIAAEQTAKEKLANAPYNVKQFMSLKFMAKKWAIVKSTDKVFLKLIAEYDISCSKLATQRLTELGS